MKKAMKQTWSNEEFRQKHSEALKRAYENPELRQKVSSSIKRAYKNPELRQKRSNSAKEAWASKEARQKLSNSLKKAYENPKLRQKLSNSIKKAYRNSDVRQRLSNSLKKAYQEHSKAIQQKRHSTMKANNSFNSSKPEQYIKEILEQTFNKVHYQYRSNLYPFNCDFYIEDLDLFIELNFHWTHGGRLFNSICQDCLKQLNDWQEKAKSSKFYQNAIYTWTDLDVRKAQCAKDNGLNWMAFYSLEEFENAITKIDF